MTETTLTPRGELRELIETAEFGEIALPSNLMDRTWYVKYESMNPLLSDTQHGQTWDEQVTASERAGLMEDDGCIMTFRGFRRSEVAITDDGSVLEEPDAEAREDATGKPLPRYAAYDFRLHKLEKTDGLRLRQELHSLAEDQRANSESKLLTKLTDTLGNLSVTQNGTQNQNEPGVQDVQEYLSSLHPAQKKALIEMAEEEAEELKEA
jgi:hypothetical protein|tara:strand:- start:2320 stop:2946 length:627 start_codon:yes stop_codon:yes gene_type:complete